MRPANLVTAVADVAAGFGISLALAGKVDIWQGLRYGQLDFILLCLATIGLYGGGVVFNDVFDFKIDQIERPERPLPSGRVSLKQAIALGIVLFSIGILAAFLTGILAGLLAILIALLALLYDAKGKHHPVLGPLNMSLCRGANLLLGLSFIPESLLLGAGLVILPVIYISSITLISRGEVAGGNKSHLNLAIVGYSLVAAILLGLGLVFPYQMWYALGFVLLFSSMVFPPLIRAWKSLDPGDIRKAVKAGVITLIILNAALAAGFTTIVYGLFIAALLPLSLWLGKYFSVT